MDLTGLRKEEKKRLLIDSVKSKSSLRFKIYSDIDPLSDKELEEFFEQVHDRIDYIIESTTESHIMFFYDIIRKKDGAILFRSANVFDEKRWIREERNKKIDDILNTAIKPR